jgi:tetratricopeptide (TPR) repeat protein
MKKVKENNSDSRFFLMPVTFFLLIIAALAVLSYTRNTIYESHVTLWADVTKRSPNKRRAHENYGQALSTAGRYNEALQEFKTVIALKDDGSVPPRDLYRELGVVYFRMALYQDAISAWQKGLQAAPYDPSLLNNLSIVMLHEGRLDEAAADAQMALASAPGMPQALNTMGQVYLMKKDFKKASSYFYQALEVEPHVAQRYWNLALALEQAGQYDKAYEYANRYAAMETDPVARRRAYGYLEHLKQVMRR